MKKGDCIEVLIDGTAFKGKGVGRFEERAVFVKGAMPGDRVSARIIKKKKNFLEAKLLEILSPSSDRISPLCSHAGVCGGCSWQHVPYPKQLEFKRQQVEDHITRIGKCSTPVDDIIGCPAPLYYRNKMEYSFSPRRWLTEQEIRSEEFVDDAGFAAGLHAPGRFDKILDLQECHLQHPISYQILDHVRSFALEYDIPAYDTFNKEGFFRHLVIRKSHYTNDLMVVLVSYYEDMNLINTLLESLKQSFPEITTFIYSINDTPSPTAYGRIEHVLLGPGYIRDSIGEFTFNIHPKAFFQTNTQQAEALYEVALKFANLQPDDLVYDLYCGVGTLSLYLSKVATKVVGIELVEEAIENAKKNAQENEINHAYFVKGDMKDTFNETLIAEYGVPTVLVTDPPRAGMHPDVVQQLLDLKTPRIVYVSCDSSTMARDIEKLSSLYKVDAIQPVDMFPQTYHIETVALLTLK